MSKYLFKRFIRLVIIYLHDIAVADEHFYKCFDHHWLVFEMMLIITLPALNLKGIEFEYSPVHLVKDGGEQVRYLFLVLHLSGPSHGTYD